MMKIKRWRPHTQRALDLSNTITCVDTSVYLPVRVVSNHTVIVCVEPVPKDARAPDAYRYISLVSSLPAESVDAVFVHHVLHHAGDVEQHLVDMCTSLRVGGRLELKEHDCDSPRLRTALRALHYMYSVLDGAPVNSDLGTAYLPALAWRELISRIPGMRVVDVKGPSPYNPLKTFVLTAVKGAISGHPKAAPAKGYKK